MVVTHNVVLILFFSVTDENLANCQKKFQLFPYIVILNNSVLFVEEIIFSKKKQPQKEKIRGRSLILS